MTAWYTYENQMRYLTTPAGSEAYWYTVAGQRARQGRTGMPDRYFFYGLRGEVLGIYGSTPRANGTYYISTVHSTRVWLGGLLVSSDGNSITRDQLGSVVNSGTETLSYYPYGEQRTGTTTNDREKFATYLRDENTRLDYAQQRYYASTTGRFWTPDPAGMDAVDMENPTSWNMYAYVNGDPVKFTDPDGLVACGNLINGATGTSVSSIMTTYNDLGYLAQTIWHEGGPVWKTDSTDINNVVTQQAYIATALENRYDIANGNIIAYTAQGGTVNPALFGGPGTSLTNIILQAAGNNQSWGIYTNGKLDSMSTLQQVLRTDVAVGTQVALPSGNSVNAECFAVLSAATEAILAQGGARYEPSGVILAYWNLATNSSPDPRNTQTVPKFSLNGDTFYGYFTTQQPKRPIQRPRRPPIKVM